ncbi:HAD superfamily hydrolase (TIGR01509 family) [Catenuloplanes nepalensis]|uniref:HAD superfamily hydrolase (TIGR01509 family) n=1 Tax=Catenuloplanes nepalensis TaxID=587533 RepID=A0ABT9MWU1_9ACTN|nr:HAD superfamily hydrolase (TIGR01509 family) [Catenuloplanes nepalensis]
MSDLRTEPESPAVLRPAAVLFDMDGTLIDSEKVWEIAIMELARSYGGELSEEARAAMVGAAMAESMRVMHEDLGQPWRDPVAGARELEDRVAELFTSGLVWRPGAMVLLAAVRAAGIPTALVTSTSRRLVEVALDTLGRNSFDAVICGDEVTANKPDPAPYRMAADALGVDITACVAIEDSPAGIASAKAAGATVLAVPCELDLSHLNGETGIHLRSSLDDVDVPHLATLLVPSKP